jgi:hypothetical protein
LKKSETQIYLTKSKNSPNSKKFKSSQTNIAMLEAASKTATDLIMKRVVSNYYEIDDLGDIFN